MITFGSDDETTQKMLINRLGSCLKQIGSETKPKTRVQSVNLNWKIM